MGTALAEAIKRPAAANLRKEAIFLGKTEKGGWFCRSCCKRESGVDIVEKNDFVEE